MILIQFYNNKKHLKIGCFFVWIIVIWDYYHTTDGIHWDEKTSQLYVKEMLDYSGDV